MTRCQTKEPWWADLLWAALPTVGFLLVFIVLSAFVHDERMHAPGVAPVTTNAEAR